MGRKSEVRSPKSETVTPKVPWPHGARHFVAYHNVEGMGHDYEATDGFGFLSRKPRSVLLKSIGEAVWAITGKRDANGKKRYRLAAVYEPSELQYKRDRHLIIGTKGHVFDPPVELNGLPWCADLLREQTNFSLGFNAVKSKRTIQEFLTLFDDSASKSEDAPQDPYRDLTDEDYRVAFDKIRPKLNAKQMEMLRAHYSAPGKKITARQASVVAGYTSWEGANLHYGKIGSLLCGVLGGVEGYDAIGILARFIRPGTGANQEWIWQMRERVASALEKLGWVQVGEIQPPAFQPKTAPCRVATTVNRIARDTVAARSLKALYDSTCQVCGMQVQYPPGEFHIEVHHIRPLGDEHDGPDELSNMLVLCPNHHLMFDLRMPEFLGRGKIAINGHTHQLEMRHQLSTDAIAYHTKLRNEHR